MAEFYSILTNEGLAAVAAAMESGVKVDLTHMAVGDGGGNPVQPTPDQTALVGEKWRGYLSEYTRDGDRLLITAIIPADSESFTVREFGVYTTDGILFAVANTPDIRKVLPSEGAVGDFAISMELIIANQGLDTIVVQVDPQLDFIPNKDRGVAGGVATLGEDGKVIPDQLPNLGIQAQVFTRYNGGAG